MTGSCDVCNWLCEGPGGPKLNYCAHQNETRVARSREDFVRFFKKLDKSTPKPTRTQPKGWRVPGQGAGESLVRY